MGVTLITRRMHARTHTFNRSSETDKVRELAQLVELLRAAEIYQYSHLADYCEEVRHPRPHHQTFPGGGVALALTSFASPPPPPTNHYRFFQPI